MPVSAVPGLRTGEADLRPGAAALADGDVVGYLLGRRREASWGPNIWVDPAGHAVGRAELVSDLYAAAAARWVGDGLTSHYAMVPATDPALVDAWLRLGFGHQHVYAIRETPPAEPSHQGAGLVVRRARRDDIDALARLDLVLPQHQTQSPVFARLPLPTSRRRGRSTRRTSTTAVHDIRRRARRRRARVRDRVPDRGLFDAQEPRASTGRRVPRLRRGVPRGRGGGAGRLLGEAVFDWARETGREWVVTDWRMTNLPASRAWPRLGFRPTFYRLFRAIP